MPPPATSATTKPGRSAGRIPANVSVKPRAIVTAALANDLDDVNQYAATMKHATAYGTAPGRVRATARITATSPNVATTSARSSGEPWRAVVDHVTGSSPNIAFARIAPAIPPPTCATR